MFYQGISGHATHPMGRPWPLVTYGSPHEPPHEGRRARRMVAGGVR